jgi:hypothetical protein
MRASIALAAILGLLTGSAAMAKDICVHLSPAGTFVFRGVKKLKPGGAIPLAGFFFNPGSVPVGGSAIMRASGTVLVGFTVYTDGAALVQTFTATTDSELNGTAIITSGPSAGTVLSLTAIDCKTVTVP